MKLWEILILSIISYAKWELLCFGNNYGLLKASFKTSKHSKSKSGVLR